MAASNHSSDIHWPAGFSPDEAHGFFQRRAVLQSSPERAFTLLTEVSAWPTRSPGVSEVSSEALAQFFKVQWYGHPFEVFVGENKPPYRLGWLGIGAGVQLYQAWLIAPADDGTHTLSANVVRSSAPKDLDVASATWLEKLDDLWTAQIRNMADGRPWRVI
ncbi:hypothetical protein ACIQZB_40690 [Streptomyces sp. NPDC097727]|uniref:hypothetical protein n=1 Tax=Streptomyces sp. NPDC097727 TaxID=3366092 RepID=UPI0037FF45B0